MAEEDTTPAEGQDTTPAEGQDNSDTPSSDGENAGTKDGAQDAQATDGAPEEYAEFVVPEGYHVDETTLAEAAPIFKELGISQEGAQKLVDFYAKQSAAAHDGQVELFESTKEDWKNTAASDKEYGGEAFEENVKIAKQAIDKFGSPELAQVLESSGLGNHPEMIRTFWKVGQLTLEDDGRGGGRAGSSEASRVDQLYPKSGS